jgi:hypothetical protein
LNGVERELSRTLWLQCLQLAVEERNV